MLWPEYLVCFFSLRRLYLYRLKNFIFATGVRGDKGYMTAWMVVLQDEIVEKNVCQYFHE